ncbi:hypothetical protein N9381_08105 [Paracoccaceae bacterium]|jgi:hypothetical protein|nr:hypothetical protein [Paracoccaceae bacterium]MDB3911731.1 hypothetical protein [Paracoccaceae bacterium]HBR63535.1 hypothetical protein [Paracoccaceae bacterium]HBS39229.1 hypothetical protein [Paracoccaceae bacterium]|tara:strand:- start:2553 stop:2816 length:264 start_codon:yes stop_codon:yes gene_type:complete
MLTSKASEYVYLERRRYRTRRIIEALKVLPVLGIVLFGVPLLWSEGVKTSDAMIYFFSVWLALVFAAVWLARRLGAGAVEKSLETDN